MAQALARLLVLILEQMMMSHDASNCHRWWSCCPTGEDQASSGTNFFVMTWSQALLAQIASAAISGSNCPPMKASENAGNVREIAP